MPFELRSSAGRFVLEDSCQIRIERNGRTILQSGGSSAFGFEYGVEANLRAITSVEQGAGSLSIVFGTTWPNLSLMLEVEESDFGFRLLWSAPPRSTALGVTWNLRPQGPWYGQGERVIQPWPLDRLSAIADPLMPCDHSPDGTLDISTPLWINASGAAILIEEGAGDLAATVGRSDDGLLRIVLRATDSVPGDDLTAAADRSGPRLGIDLLLADSPADACRLALLLLGHPTTSPPDQLFAEPIWTTWARYKMGVTQLDVTQFASEIVERGYPRSVMEIDDRWQSSYGACEFDPVKFPEPRAMVDRLHEQGFKVTLWMPPFFDPASPAFAEAAQRGFLLRHPATDQPYLVRWWQGYGGVIDVSNRDALDWWLDRLRRLQDEFGIDGFKFDGGEGNFMPRDARTAVPMHPRSYADRYVQFVAEQFTWTEVRCGWRSQRHGLLFREWDKWSHWGLHNGLHSVLTQALTLSIIGYPFVLPDMIGGNAYGGLEPDAELLIRWTQLSALLPAMQFSIPPWQFDDETDAICRRYAVFHNEIAPYIHSLVEQTCRDGTPVIRPLFWHTRDDFTALSIDDEFLLGDLLLVAPVLHAGQRERNVYLPAGRWRDRWNGTTFEGPTWLEQYAAPLDRIPLFERLDTR